MKNKTPLDWPRNKNFIIPMCENVNGFLLSEQCYTPYIKQNLLLKFELSWVYDHYQPTELLATTDSQSQLMSGSQVDELHLPSCSPFQSLQSNLQYCCRLPTLLMPPIPFPNPLGLRFLVQIILPHHTSQPSLLSHLDSFVTSH